MSDRKDLKVRMNLAPKQAEQLAVLFDEAAKESGTVIIGQAWWGTKSIKPHVIFKCLTLEEVIEAVKNSKMDTPKAEEE